MATKFWPTAASVTDGTAKSFAKNHVLPEVKMQNTNVFRALALKGPNHFFNEEASRALTICESKLTLTLLTDATNTLNATKQVSSEEQFSSKEQSVDNSNSSRSFGK